MDMSKPQKRALYGVCAAFLVVGIGWGASAMFGHAAELPDSRIAAVERGTMVRSVVAIGKIEPITKVEIKSKANGIIKVLPIEVDQLVDAGGVLVELDRENLIAQRREARATLLAARAAEQAAEAQLEKARVEARGPDVEFARRTYERATSLSAQKLIAQSELDQARTNLDQAENRQKAAETQLSITKA